MVKKKKQRINESWSEAIGLVEGAVESNRQVISMRGLRQRMEVQDLELGIRCGKNTWFRKPEVTCL